MYSVSIRYDEHEVATSNANFLIDAITAAIALMPAMYMAVKNEVQVIATRSCGAKTVASLAYYLPLI